jgi:transglutaminase-like putative cysteine protease
VVLSGATDLTRAGPKVRALTRGLKEEQPEDIPRLHALSARITAAVPYEIGLTHAATTAEEAVEIGGGVCQDHAQIFVAAARHLGYPARYVSGYLMMSDRVHQDASHAWAEAMSNRWAGWVSTCRTAIRPMTRYVRVATGLDYRDAAPVSGLRFGKPGEAMSIDIQVQQQ